MVVPVAEGEPAGRIHTCPVCGELFASIASLDAHLPAVLGPGHRCLDPWTETHDDDRYVFRFVAGTGFGTPIVWSLN